VLNREALQKHARSYYGDLDPTDPLISPVYGDIRRVCSTAIFTGTRDLCYADCKKLKLKADSEPVVFEFRAFEGLFHNWPMHLLPVGQSATAMLISHLKHVRSEAELSLSQGADFWKN
jgi:acetyl esterase/lipase